MDGEDRSEKIVSLARTMLQEPPRAFLSRRYGMPTSALTAPLSIAGSTSITMLTAEQARPLNRYEKTELLALIHYAAKRHQVAPSSSEAALLQQCAVQSLDDLQHAALPAAHLFLLNQIEPPLSR